MYNNDFLVEVIRMSEDTGSRDQEEMGETHSEMSASVHAECWVFSNYNNYCYDRNTVYNVVS